MNFCPECGAKVNGKFCTNCGTSLQVAETQAPTAKADTAAPMPPEPKNDGLISLLYALRAGISHLSLKYDEYKKAEQAQEQIVQLNKSRNEKQKELGQKIRDLTEKKNSLLPSTLESKLKDAEIRMQEAEEKDRPLRFWHRLFVVLIFVFPILAIASCAISYTEFDIPIALLSVITVVSILGAILSAWITYEGFFEPHYRFAVWREIEDIRKKQKIVKDYEKETSILTMRINSPECRQVPIDRSGTQKLRREGKKLFSALVKAFGELLHPSDWAHIDSVIFCLETKRANTLEEALRQADLFVRHEEMKSVIVAVGKQICKTISNAAMHISWQLEGISETQAKIAANLREINSNLLSTKEMQESLLKKANENSEKLMQDVNRVCGYADAAAVQKGLTL